MDELDRKIAEALDKIPKEATPFMQYLALANAEDVAASIYAAAPPPPWTIKDLIEFLKEENEE